VPGVPDEGTYAAAGEALSGFDPRLHPAEDLRAVMGRAFGAPLYVLKLEAANHFATTRRVIRSALRGSRNPFPVLLLASRRARIRGARGTPLHPNNLIGISLAAGITAPPGSRPSR